MPSVMESVFEDFDEGLPEGEVVAVEVSEEAEGVPMGIGTDIRDKEVVKAEVVVGLSSTSKTIRSKTAYDPQCGTDNLNVLYVFVFPVPRQTKTRLAARPAPPVRISRRVWSRSIGSVRAPRVNVELSGDVIRTTR